MMENDQAALTSIPFLSYYAQERVPEKLTGAFTGGN